MKNNPRRYSIPMVSLLVGKAINQKCVKWKVVRKVHENCMKNLVKVVHQTRQLDIPVKALNYQMVIG